MIATIKQYAENFREGRSRRKQAPDTLRKWRGPEYPGCFNTGHRPMIASFKRHNGERLLFVGPELEVESRYLELLYSGKRSIGEGNRKVRMFKTWSSAEKAFLELVAAVLDACREYERKQQQAAALAAQGDPESKLQAANILFDL